MYVRDHLHRFRVAAHLFGEQTEVHHAAQSILEVRVDVRGQPRLIRVPGGVVCVRKRGGLVCVNRV
jgi:hypothetical protein